MSAEELLLGVAFALVLPTGQLLFKAAVLRHGRLEGSLQARVMRNPLLALACGWYGFTALFWFFVLTQTPLSRAYPFALLGAALVPLAARLVFREPLGGRFVLGYALMLAGLFLAAAPSDR